MYCFYHLSPTIYLFPLWQKQSIDSTLRPLFSFREHQKIFSPVSTKNHPQCPPTTSPISAPHIFSFFPSELPKALKKLFHIILLEKYGFLVALSILIHANPSAPFHHVKRFLPTTRNFCQPTGMVSQGDRRHGTTVAHKGVSKTHSLSKTLFSAVYSFVGDLWIQTLYFKSNKLIFRLYILCDDFISNLMFFN